jgi:prevent-host-death family protein
MRTVNVHEAKTQFSRLIDAAHAGETILVAKDGKPWARLVPLETDRPRRQPGQLQLLLIDVILAPLQIPQPIPQPRSAPRHPTQMKFCRCYGPTATAWGRPLFRFRMGQSATTRQWSISVSCSSSRTHSAEAFLQGLRPCLDQRG